MPDRLAWPVRVPRLVAGAVRGLMMAMVVAAVGWGATGGQPAFAQSPTPAPRPDLSRRLVLAEAETSRVRTLADARRLFRARAGLIIESEGLSLRQAVVLRPGDRTLGAWMGEVATAVDASWIVRDRDGAILLRRGGAAGDADGAEAGRGGADGTANGSAPAVVPAGGLAGRAELPMSVQASAAPGVTAAATPAPKAPPVIADAARVQVGSSRPIGESPARAGGTGAGASPTPAPPAVGSATPSPASGGDTSAPPPPLPFVVPEGAESAPPAIPVAPPSRPATTPAPDTAREAAPDAAREAAHQTATAVAREAPEPAPVSSPLESPVESPMVTHAAAPGEAPRPSMPSQQDVAGGAPPSDDVPPAVRSPRDAAPVTGGDGPPAPAAPDIDAEASAGAVKVLVAFADAAAAEEAARTLRREGFPGAVAVAPVAAQGAAQGAAGAGGVATWRVAVPLPAAGDREAARTAIAGGLRRLGYPVAE